MKHARGRTAGSEPDIILAVSRDTCPAGGKSAFIWQCGRHALDCHRRPRRAIAGGDEGKLAIDGIAQSNPMFAVPEGKAIIERFGIAIDELPLPDFAAVGGLINTRLFAGTNTEHERRVPIKGLNIAKIQRLSPRHFNLGPMLASVDGPQHRSLGPAGPGNAL